MEPVKPTFSDKDTERLVSLLNFVATNAEFNNVKVKDILQFSSLLKWAQTELLTKLQANVFEVTEVKQLDGKKKK